MPVNPVIFLILFGVVGAIVVFSILTNLLGRASGPWGALAQQFPEEPAETDADRGVVELAITTDPYSFADDAPRRRGVFRWIVLAIVILLGIGALIALFMSSPLAGMLLAAGAALGFTVWLVLLAGWTRRIVFAKAWHTKVHFQADDRFLHLEKESDRVAKYPRISIPWQSVPDIYADPAAGEDWVTFPLGDRWAHAQRECVARELAIRGYDLNTPPPPPPTSEREAPQVGSLGRPGEGDPRADDPLKWPEYTSASRPGDDPDRPPPGKGDPFATLDRDADRRS
jgi:hypothetical protein